MAEESNEKEENIQYLEEGEYKIFNNTQNKDISPWVTEITWGGGLNIAARTLDFSVAFTTKDKDPSFVNVMLDLGDEVIFSFHPKGSDKVFRLFTGVIFLRNRNTDGFVMEYKAYDRMIYLAKSEVQMKFINKPAKDIFTDVCNSLNIKLGKVHEDFNVACDFVADRMTATEVIKKCITFAEAKYGYRYKAIMLYNNETKEQELNVVRADTTDTVANFKLSDKANLLYASHGESLEDMVNRVAVANDNGDVTGYIKLEDDIKKYGLIQKVYKYNSKEPTEVSAKKLLKRVKYHSSFNALGNIQCVSGFVVKVEEEHLCGFFMIISDRHTFTNNKHDMELTLDFINKLNESDKATTEGNVNPAPTKNNGKKRGGKGNRNAKAGLQDGINAFQGASYTPDPANGCVWAATGVASYYSPWAATQYNNGVVNVPTLISNAKAAGMYQRYGEGTLEPGDIIVYDDSHVVVSTGGYGYVGNSTRQKKVVVASDFTNMGGKYATGIIKTSRS